MKAMLLFKRFSLCLLLSLSSWSYASIKTYFNHNSKAWYRDPYRAFVKPGDNLERVITQSIDQARKRVWIAIHELRLPLIAHALLRAHNRGVDVRVILENQYNYSLDEVDWQNLDPNDPYTYQKNLDLFTFTDQNQDNFLSQAELLTRDAVFILKKNHIPLIDDTEDGSRGSGLMHHKFIVIDRLFSLVSSANFTLSGVHGDYRDSSSLGNANSLLKIRSFLTNKTFSHEFLIMWGDGPQGEFDSKFGIQKPHRRSRKIFLSNGTQIEIQFAPHGKKIPRQFSPANLIDKSIKNAKRKLNFLLFNFTDQEIANQLQRRSHEIKIQGLVDNNFSYRYYSELLDLMGLELLTRHCTPEKNNNPWARDQALRSVGTPRMSKGDSLHHKFATIDHHTTIFGSYNWSLASNTKNDETLMVIKNQEVNDQFNAEFKRHYRRSQLGAPHWLLKKIKQQESLCF